MLSHDTGVNRSSRLLSRSRTPSPCIPTPVQKAACRDRGQARHITRSCTRLSPQRPRADTATALPHPPQVTLSLLLPSSASIRSPTPVWSPHSRRRCLPSRSPRSHRNRPCDPYHTRLAQTGVALRQRDHQKTCQTGDMEWVYHSVLINVFQHAQSTCSCSHKVISRDCMRKLRK
jgi:hypothetical protein